jgi:predicted SAM-dependent methyltransferase
VNLSPAEPVRAVTTRVEIGAGEHPDPGYDIHTDILALDDVDVVCRLDALPFKDASVAALRANHVLEHQSFELVEATLFEWRRVLDTGGPLEVGVPDARFIAQQWVQAQIDTPEANYWLLGGHSDRPAHKGTDARGVALWVYNAHHTLFDAESLRAALETAGFCDVDIECYAVRNLRATCVRGP